ncbi:hypothetical protein ACFO3O_18860 [Dokdonia ponticola]|uniref:Uncharacterized protein n=1 Tax=Dokdonia ponticola TaxID=2041041 RepID=A0ABV9I2Q5_9FLAO
MEIIYGFQNLDRTNIEVMTEQQALQEDYYHKIFKGDNGLIKKIETYSNQNLLGIDYYLDTGEDESQLLSEFYQLVGYVHFFDRKTPIGSYFIERERQYNKSENSDSVYDYHVRVFDAQDRLVCYASTDENDIPFVDLTKKYLYTDITTIETDGNTTVDLFYVEFSYNDGEILGIDVSTGHLVYMEKYLIDDLDDIDELLERFGGTINEYNYYLHANWMP